jgi:hypothetical protein
MESSVFSEAESGHFDGVRSTVSHCVYGSFHQSASRLGGYSELLTYLAITTFPTIEKAESLLYCVASSRVENVQEAGSHLAFRSVHYLLLGTRV